MSIGGQGTTGRVQTKPPTALDQLAVLADPTRLQASIKELQEAQAASLDAERKAQLAIRELQKGREREKWITEAEKARTDADRVRREVEQEAKEKRSSLEVYLRQAKSKALEDIEKARKHVQETQEGLRFAKKARHDAERDAAMIRERATAILKDAEEKQRQADSLLNRLQICKAAMKEALDEKV